MNPQECVEGVDYIKARYPRAKLEDAEWKLLQRGLARFKRLDWEQFAICIDEHRLNHDFCNLPDIMASLTRAQGGPANPTISAGEVLDERSYRLSQVRRVMASHGARVPDELTAGGIMQAWVQDCIGCVLALLGHVPEQRLEEYSKDLQLVGLSERQADELVYDLCRDKPDQPPAEPATPLMAFGLAKRGRTANEVARMAEAANVTTTSPNELLAMMERDKADADLAAFDAKIGHKPAVTNEPLTGLAAAVRESRLGGTQ